MCAFVLNLISCAILLQSPSSDIPVDTTGIIEPFPILSYDTDAGFGYGGKAVFRNQLGHQESLDLTVFASTKGERWYRLGVSFPDAELRHGHPFVAAFDVVVDYDKWIRNSYFGVGNRSAFAGKKEYTKEPLEASVAASHGFTSTLVGELTVRYRAVRFSQAPGSVPILSVLPEGTPASAKSISGGLTLRHDSRNSVINPMKGSVVGATVEYAQPMVQDCPSYVRLGAAYQQYQELPWYGVILAWRCSLTGLIGSNIPVQVLLPAGGNNTLRGSVQDRFLDKVAGLVNAEMRIPLTWRLGIIAGMDAGRVWSTFGQLSLQDWTMNPAAGLRLYMETFVVRLDVGIGKETTGVFLNFGHIF